MITASAGWVAAHRQLLLPETFIEIEYTVSEPGLQEDAVATGSGQLSFSKASEITAVRAKSSEKYATLEHGMWGLDGSFTYFNDAPTNPGYVTRALSGADGGFDALPTITICALYRTYAF